MSSACHMVWIYYDLRGQKPIFENLGDVVLIKEEASGVDRHDSLVNDLCVKNHIYYYSWFLVNLVMTVLRTQSLLYMLRGYKNLQKRADDNVKKLKAKREKIKKLRRSKKKEFNKALTEKRNELYRRN